MSDFFDNIDEVEIDSSFAEEQEYDKPKHKFVVQAFVGDRFENEQIKHIVCSCLNKLHMDLKYDVVITSVTAIAEFVQSNGIKPSVQVNIDVYGDFNNIYEVVDFVDALCFGRYVHVINGNLPFPSMFIKYLSPVTNDIQIKNIFGVSNSRWSVSIDNRYEVNFEITPDIYLSNNMSDFEKNDFSITAYTNSLLKICHLAIDDNQATEEEMMHCLGIFPRDMLNDAQNIHIASLRANDIITINSDLNLTKKISEYCCPEGDTLGEKKYFYVIDIFKKASNRIKNLDVVLDDNTTDENGRSVLKTIGLKRILNKEEENYVTVWDGYPSTHHQEDTQYNFFMRMFYNNREQLKRKFRFPTVTVPNITFYDSASDYIRITLRLGSIYDEKTKSVAIVTMGLCGNFDSVMNLIKILYK